MQTYRIMWADGAQAVIMAETRDEAERTAGAREIVAPAPVRIEPDGERAYWLAWCPSCAGRVRIPAGVDDRTGVEIDPRDWAAGELVRACPECGDGAHHIAPVPIRGGTVIG